MELDLILRIGREIQNVGRDPDYQQERHSHQSRQHKRNTLPRRAPLGASLIYIRLSTAFRVDTVFT